MALIHLDFESEYLGTNQDVDIIVPDKPRDISTKDFYSSGRKYKVLWLLHGTFGGHSDWLRKSNIELYACEKNLIVVMPGVGNSNYEKWDNFTIGFDADKYIVDELMPLVYGWLPASDKREDNYIAGLSMGGQGTLRFALKYPEKFAAAAVLSYIPADERANREQLDAIFNMSHDEVFDPADVMHMKQRLSNNMHRYESVDAYLESWSELYHKVNEADPAKLPRMFFGCGTEDPLFSDRIESFQAHLKELGIEAEWALGPGSHEWRVWDRDIQKALEFFNLEEDGQGNAF